MCVLVAPHSSAEARVPSSQGHSDTDRAVACWSSVSARARRVVIGPLPSKRLRRGQWAPGSGPCTAPFAGGLVLISFPRAGQATIRRLFHHRRRLLLSPGLAPFALLFLPCLLFVAVFSFINTIARPLLLLAWFANLEDASLHPLVIHSFVAPPHAALYDYTRAPPIRLTPLPRIVRLHSFSRHPSSPSPSHRLGRRHNPLSRRLAACHCYACVTIPSQLLIVLRAV